MFEIIPNWHPVFVHFTVALLSLSVVLFAVTPFMHSPLREQWQIVARWTLWFGAGFTVLTGLAGLDAYNTVAHDTPSHVAMTEHRNWAIATMLVFFTLAIWSFIRVRRQQVASAVFVVLMLTGGGLLASTAWHGGEAVYRYGLGVMSLPVSEGKGHAHQHANGSGHSETKETEKMEEHDDDHSHNDMTITGQIEESDGHDHEH